MRNNWGPYIADARKKRGMNRTAFADAVGIGRTTAWRWESSDQRPENVDVVLRVASVLGLDIDEALAAAGLSPDREPPEPQAQEPELDARALAIARDLQIISDRLYAPDLTDDERIQIETQLDMLVDLARQVAGRRRART